MAQPSMFVYVDINNYIYSLADDGKYLLIQENSLQNIFNGAITGPPKYIINWSSSSFDYNQIPTLPIHELTEEEYNQIQAGTFPYGIPPVTSRDFSPVQPLLTYSINWGTNNVYQKLSGKSYTAPNGQTVDCSTITVTFSSSQHFKKFYATAVKNGNDYGFIDDVLVDIRQTNPTGVLLHELTSRNANTDFTFTINTSSFTAGDGQYRIGLYVQNDDNIWNYEYFLVDVNNNPIVDSQGNSLQVPVLTTVSTTPDCGFIVNNNILTITDNSKLLNDGIINDDNYLLVTCNLSENVYQALVDIIRNDTASIDMRIFNSELQNQGIYDEGLSITLTDGINQYQILLNSTLLNCMQFAVFNGTFGEAIFVISKEYITGTFTILNKETYYVIYSYDYGEIIVEFNPINDIYSFENSYEDRIILEIIDLNDLDFDISF